MVEIIFENYDCLPFFESSLSEIKVEYRLNFIGDFELELNQPPDDIVFINRVSSSSHSRGNHSAIIKGEQYLEYLAAYNRIVINDYRTINYEISKIEQIKLLKRFGLSYPQTIFSSEKDELIKMASSMPLPCLIKHNCSGKGFGISLINSNKELATYLDSVDFIPSSDGVLLLQQYIKPKNDFITRVEIINGKLVYAFRSATDRGFKLYPADASRTDIKAGDVCDSDNSLFTYIPDFEHPLVDKYIEIAKATGFDMVGFEFVEGVNGAIYTYVINSTTNYSPDVEQASGFKAKAAFQEMVLEKLNK